ncbi:MAG: DUF4335 domain-containing protein [Cyanobacteria bacterium P01_C01_bin.120]
MTSTTQLTPLHYTAPTVTLEVMAREAAVSQWSERPVVQILRYQIQIRSLNEAEPPVELQGDRDSFLPLMQAVQTYVQQQLSGEELARDRHPNGPFLEPHGLTRHTLYLGTGRTQSGAPSIALGAVQLADFEQVLDQLGTTVRPLPVTLVPTSQRRTWRRWSAIAASMVAAVGISTTLWSNYQPQSGTETALEAPTADSAPTPSLEEGPGTGAPQPEDSADESAAAVVPETAAESTDADSSPSPSAKPPVDSSPLTNRRAKTRATSPAASVPTDETLSAEAPRDEQPPPEIADDEAVATEDAAPTAAPPQSTGAPVESARTRQPPAAPEIVSAPADRAPAPAAEAPTAPARSAGAADADAQIAETFSDNLPESLTPPGASPPPPEPPAVLEPLPGSRADLMQQVRDRWTPLADLEQMLTYTLTFAPDGTLIEVLPADTQAANYLDQTGIPPIGSQWLATDEPQQILLLLYPDGNVEFQEAESSQGMP